MTEAGIDTKWQEATPSRLAIEILRGAAEEIVRHKAAGVPMNSDAIPVKASVLLSLLDRIEELEGLVRASRAEADACVLYGNAHHHSDALVDDQNRAVKRRD